MGSLLTCGDPHSIAKTHPHHERFRPGRKDSGMEVNLLKKTAIASVTAILGALVLMWIMQGSATAQKAPVPKPQDKLALGENDVKQLMLLIDTDKNGKITKQAWMEFMEAEFDRLDKNKSGELDAQELALSRLRVSPFAKVGK
jgi:hypothetical protein